MLINALLYGVLVLMFNLLFEKQRPEVDILRKDSNVLVMGDSHCSFAINDILYPIFENRAQINDCYFAIYHKLLAILNHPENLKSNLKVVCLGYNYFSLKTSDHYIGDKATYWYNENQPILRNLNNYPADFGYPINESRLSLYVLTHLPKIENLLQFVRYGETMNFSRYHGGFSNKDHNARVLNTEIDNVHMPLNRHYGNLPKSGHPELLEEMAGYEMLQRIAELLQRKNIPLVLINLPQHREYNERVYPWLAELHTKCALDLAKKYGTIYLDWHDMPLDNELFFDYDHLNINGAKVVTPILLRELQDRGLIKNINHIH